MGRIAAPFGVKGWLRVEPFTAAAKNLLAYPIWWIRDGRRDNADWRECAVVEAKAQGRAVIARLAGRRIDEIVKENRVLSKILLRPAI